MEINHTEVRQDPNWYYKPSDEEKKLAIIEDLKRMAPEDWDQLTIRELVHIMAIGDVVFRVDTSPWLKNGGDA